MAPQHSSLYNLAHDSNWVLEFPVKSAGLGAELEAQGYEAKTFRMNITNFTLGRIQLKSNDVSRLDYTLTLPTGTEATQKTFTVGYLLSSQYQQYYFLTRLWQRNLEVINHVDDTDIQEYLEDSEDSYYLMNVKLWLLNENKDPVMKITYHDVWLSALGELQLTYNKTSGGVLSHTFECTYNNYTIELINPNSQATNPNPPAE